MIPYFIYNAALAEGASRDCKDYTNNCCVYGIPSLMLPALWCCCFSGRVDLIVAADAGRAPKGGAQQQWPSLGLMLLGGDLTGLEAASLAMLCR